MISFYETCEMLFTAACSAIPAVTTVNTTQTDPATMGKLEMVPPIPTWVRCMSLALSSASQNNTGSCYMESSRSLGVQLDNL